MNRYLVRYTDGYYVKSSEIIITANDIDDAIKNILERNKEAKNIIFIKKFKKIELENKSGLE
jgi:hypothetical protein